MKSYNQFCPIAKAAEVFCERWTALILRDLAAGPARFSELQRGVPLASPSLLSQRLKQLEAEGIVARERPPTGKQLLYRLTPAGEEFIPIVMALGVWGQRWSRRELAEHEVDLGLLLWALEKGADATAFGAARTVIEMRFVDQPEHKALWWYLNEGGSCELCLKPPDHDADVYVEIALVDMIRIWRGDITLARARAEDRILVSADAATASAFERWLAIVPIADVASARDEAVSSPAGRAGLEGGPA